MEVTVLKGRGADVQELADHVIAERGVRHGQVVYLPAHDAHTHRAGGALKGSHTHRRRA
jgi:CopG family nickel-responsive transcriptional regulator